MAKPKPEPLPGSRDRRVFIGGHYDFMPVLRAIEDFVGQFSLPETPFYPIIPLDYEIPPEDTINEDVRMLMDCARAIFDLSDLGGQLIEMQVARENRRDDPRGIDSLLVYPVRDRRNEPARGRRTVISFGLPHFGYITLNELKGIVWRFLVKMPAERDYSPRVVYNPVLDRELRHARVLLARRDRRAAGEKISELLTDARFRDSLEVHLEAARIFAEVPGPAAPEEYLRSAERLSHTDADRAECLYYRAILQTPDWARVRTTLEEAATLKPNDGRVSSMLGYACSETADLRRAIEVTRAGLLDRDIPDPVITIHLMNNLAYFLCDLYQTGEGREGGEALHEAVWLSDHFEDYDKVFRKQDGYWLDTRGRVLTLKAQYLARQGDAAAGLSAVNDAIRLLETAAGRGSDSDIERRLEEAREVRRRI